MVRPSNRDRIIEAALELVGQHGIQSLTYESLAERTGISKGGIIYHFDSKQTLLRELLAHVSHMQNEAILREIGDLATQHDTADWTRAYIDAIAHGFFATGELAVLVDSLRDDDLRAHWDSVPPVGPTFGELTQDQQIARLAIDGLWFNDAIGETALTPDERTALLNRLRKLATQ